ncbi:MAG: hypothetical protein AMXMBFR23_26400 [Chloroflexota bacterium]
MEDVDQNPGTPDWVGTSPHDIFTDTVMVNLNSYAATLSFGVRPVGTGEAREVARLRTSVEFAEILRRVLTQLLYSYAADVRPITVPAEILKELGITDDDLEELRLKAAAKAKADRGTL